MKVSLVIGLSKLRLLRLERAERFLHQARAISAKCAAELAELHLIRADFTSLQSQREEKLFEEYCSTANESDSLNRYRHLMSNIIEEGIKIEQRVDEALKALENANAAEFVAREKHSEADRNVSKLNSVIEHFHKETVEDDRRMEEREMGEWLNVSLFTKPKR